MTLEAKQKSLDFDLSELYEVEKRILNQALKRNIKRFPSDFMFQISNKEFDNLMSQIVISGWGRTRKLPYAFTEQGVAMLAKFSNTLGPVNQIPHQSNKISIQ